MRNLKRFCLLSVFLFSFYLPVSAQDYIRVTKSQWTSIVQLSQKLGSCIENQSLQINDLQYQILNLNGSIVNLKKSLTSSANLLNQQASDLETLKMETQKQKDSYLILTASYNRSILLNKILGIGIGVVGIAAITEGVILFIQNNK
jgi:TolA-binding protein